MKTISNAFKNKLQNIVSGYKINEDDQAWLLALLDLKESSWSTDFPSKSGFYAWREIGTQVPHPELVIVNNKDSGVFVTFEQTLELPADIEHMARREWLKIPG